MKKPIAFLKGVILLSKPGFWSGFIFSPLEWWVHMIKLSKWVSKNRVDGLNDYYSPFRDYSKRYKLYQSLVEKYDLKYKAIIYLEFGVSKGLSFKWWTQNNQNENSRFYGFDTFEGLPEKWGNFEKGSMSAEFPEINDSRHEFIKGLFQDSLTPFLTNTNFNSDAIRIFHLDADLFSSTLYVLATCHNFIRKGDILIFDEFNVPQHEFKAFTNYVESFYVKYSVVGAVNNYFQVAIMID